LPRVARKSFREKKESVAEWMDVRGPMYPAEPSLASWSL
jgi:hypothetical protein